MIVVELLGVRIVDMELHDLCRRSAPRLQVVEVAVDGAPVLDVGRGYAEVGVVVLAVWHRWRLHFFERVGLHSAVASGGRRGLAALQLSDVFVNAVLCIHWFNVGMNVWIIWRKLSNRAFNNVPFIDLIRLSTLHTLSENRSLIIRRQESDCLLMTSLSYRIYFFVRVAKKRHVIFIFVLTWNWYLFTLHALNSWHLFWIFFMNAFISFG